MKNQLRIGILVPALAGLLMQATAQNPRPTPPAPTPATTPANGQTTAQGNRPAGPNTPARGPKAYKEVITEKAISQSGVVKLHQVENNWFMEIPNAVLGKEMLLVNRISKGAAGVRLGGGFSGFAGDILGEAVLTFEKGPDDKIFIRKISYRERGSDSAGMYQAVRNSNIQPIVYAFDIKAYGKDSASSVVDITPLLNADNELFGFSSNAKRSYSLGGVQPDKSYILSAKTYPTNIHINTVKTYSRAQAPTAAAGGFGGGGGSSDPATFELSNSLVLLPEKPMMARLYDDRVGYFATRYVDFDLNPQGVKNITQVVRWRLEPKPEDVERYKRGELVEPKKQIVYYIDPATPKKWIPYLIQGVNDWQVAFEKAGFKNAIVGKMAPTKEEDSTWSLEDARYSAIVYKPSEIQNASGPNVHDPRSGEIMESHINWYHNVMKLLRDWYFIQAAAIDEGARKLQFDDELMGQLIRFVSSHEVGHTLGLRHNFGSSSTVPVEKLRDKAWVEANGHTPSIMDYARFNYVAQPEDGISRKGIFPRIGDYDLWAIEWGYRWIPEAKTPQQETPILNKWVVEKLKNPRNWFGDGEGYGDDPRSQTEDLGDNSMKASSYGIKNLQRIMPNLENWTRTPNEGYDEMAQMYNQVVTQFGRYIGHVSRHIGGIRRTAKTVEMPGDLYEHNHKSLQTEAMKWLQDNVFTTPTWIIEPKTSAYANVSPTSVIGSLQSRALGALVSPNTASKLLRFEAEKPAEAYTLLDMMNDLRKGVFSELASRKPVDIYRRALQKSLTERLISIVKPAQESSNITISGVSVQISSGTNTTSDLLSVAKAQLRTLQAEIKAASPLISDANTRIHLTDLQERIQQALNPR